MTIRHLKESALSRLEPHYGRGEAEALMRIIFEHLKGWDMTYLCLHAEDEVSDFIKIRVDDIVERLLHDEPIQYITGDVYWHGMHLCVTPAVLIPRAETAELIDIIIDENKRRDDLAVIDACTGSGCMAIALSRNLPFARVVAFDISADALAVARKNASLKKARINFVIHDALSRFPFDEQSFDIVVSNPPYITESERGEMSANVLDYEPAVALFVPDNDPLRFYKAIASEAFRVLKPGGKLYFEINPLYAADITAFLVNSGWEDVVISKDIHGRDRFAKANRPQ